MDVWEAEKEWLRARAEREGRTWGSPPAAPGGDQAARREANRQAWAEQRRSRDRGRESTRKVTLFQEDWETLERYAEQHGCLVSEAYHRAVRALMHVHAHEGGLEPEDPRG